MNNLFIDGTLVRSSEMKLGQKRFRKECNVKRHIILANQKTEYLVHRWLSAYAMFDITCFYRICLGIGGHFKRSVNTLIKHMGSELLLKDFAVTRTVKGLYTISAC